eukprot:6200525-Lingulodinium_polyedra.AAC.1
MLERCLVVVTPRFPFLEHACKTVHQSEVIRDMHTCTIQPVHDDRHPWGAFNRARTETSLP